MDTISLGGFPAFETVEATPEKMKAATYRYEALLRKIFPCVEGTFFRIACNPHDFGKYWEVEVCFNEDNPKSYDFALFCEANCPEYWLEDVADIQAEKEKLDKKWAYKCLPKNHIWVGRWWRHDSTGDYRDMIAFAVELRDLFQNDQIEIDTRNVEFYTDVYISYPAADKEAANYALFVSWSALTCNQDKNLYQEWLTSEGDYEINYFWPPTTHNLFVSTSASRAVAQRKFGATPYVLRRFKTYAEVEEFAVRVLESDMDSEELI